MQPQEKKLGYTIYYRTLLCIILSGTWYGMAAVSAGSGDFHVKTFGVFLPIELLYSRQSESAFPFYINSIALFTLV
jgi:hypothetical protein